LHYSGEIGYLRDLYRRWLSLDGTDDQDWNFRVFVQGLGRAGLSGRLARTRLVELLRRSFGTQSEEGSHFVERVLTTVTTLQQQKRDVLDYLTQACAATMRGESPIAAARCFDHQERCVDSDQLNDYLESFYLGHGDHTRPRRESARR
jgi:hypothetical protein